jgi:serine/threonine protein phosphatase PrpC
MAIKNKVATALLSDTGRARQNNEDAVGEDRELGLLVLADGMGGYNAGEVASGIAVTTVVDSIRKEWPTIEHGEIDAETGYSNGDSRLYRFRGETLEQVTRDHTLLEELIARGHYSREDAAKLVRRNIVTRALGVEAAVQVDLIEDPLAVGDILLLCSDGLTDMLDDATISLTLKQFAANLQEVAEKLVEAANARGGKDNVSVALARIDGSFARGRRWFERLLEWF